MRCAICKKKFIPTQFLQKCCSVEHSLEWIKLNKEKLRARAEKLEKEEWKIRKTKLKEKVTGVPELTKTLQPLINRIVRLIDEGHSCISSGRNTGKKNAGHYFSTSEAPHLRFNLMNIYVQSEHDNTHLHSNNRGYRLGLIGTFGLEHFEYVDSLKGIKTPKKTKIELEAAIEKSKQVIKQLEKENKIYDNATRLKLRKKYNEYIWSDTTE